MGSLQAAKFDYIVDMVGPIPKKRTECERQIGEVIGMLVVRHKCFRKGAFPMVSIADRRKESVKLQGTLRRAIKQAKACGPIDGMIGALLVDSIDFASIRLRPTLSALLDVALQRTIEGTSAILVKPGGGQRDQWAALAVSYASSILEKFGRQSLAPGFRRQLTDISESILHEVTGNENADLKRYIGREIDFLAKRPAKKILSSGPRLVIRMRRGSDMLIWTIC